MKRRCLVAFLACFLGQLVSVHAQTYPVADLQFPFDVSRKETSFDQKIEFPQDRVYNFDLRFEFVDRADQDRLTEIIGDGSMSPDGQYGKPGIAIPIHLKIVPIGANRELQPRFDETIKTQGRYSIEFTKGLAGAFSREVAMIRLQPGIYRVTASALHDSPTLSGTPTQFVIHPEYRIPPRR